MQEKFIKMAQEQSKVINSLENFNAITELTNWFDKYKSLNSTTNSKNKLLKNISKYELEKKLFGELFALSGKAMLDGDTLSTLIFCNILKEYAVTQANKKEIEISEYLESHEQISSTLYAQFESISDAVMLEGNNFNQSVFIKNKSANKIDETDFNKLNKVISQSGAHPYVSLTKDESVGTTSKLEDVYSYTFNNLREFVTFEGYHMFGNTNIGSNPIAKK